MKKEPKISVVIPAYNEADYIRNCLDGLRAQTFKPYEILVVDNNSTDNTAKIAALYPEVILLHEKQQGIIPARDCGFNAASGDIIARIDADSLPKPDWLLTIVEAFKSKQCDALTGPVYFYDAPFELLNKKMHMLFSHQVSKSVAGYVMLWGSNMAIKKRVWHLISPQLCRQKNIHEDFDMAIHLTRKGYKVIYHKKLLVGTSLRRLQSSSKQLYHYLQLFPRTFEKHGIPGKYLTSTLTLFLLFTRPSAELIMRFYDKKTMKFSMKLQDINREDRHW